MFLERFLQCSERVFGISQQRVNFHLVVNVIQAAPIDPVWMLCEGLALEESTPEALLGPDTLHSTLRPCAGAAQWRVRFGLTVRGDRLSQACRQISHRFWTCAYRW